MARLERKHERTGGWVRQRVRRRAKRKRDKARGWSTWRAGVHPNASWDSPLAAVLERTQEISSTLNPLHIHYIPNHDLG